MTGVLGDAALNTSELWLDIFERAPIAYAIVAPDGTVVRGNERHRAMFGDDGTGPPINMVTVTHPDDRPDSIEGMASLIGGASQCYEADKRFLRSDGSAFWGHCHVTPLHGPAGEVSGVLCALEDITRWVDAQRDLSASEQRFRALVQHASDAIIVVDATASVIYASPSAGRLVGADSESQVGRNALELIHPDDRDAVATSFFNTSRTPGDAPALRFRILHADGSTRVVEAVATNQLDAPEIGGIVINVRDLTDQHEALTALQAGENRFRRLLENISDTVTVLDREGNVVDTTGNVKRILGYPVEFWAAAHMFDLIHPDDSAALASAFAEVSLAPGAEVTREFRVRTGDGTYAFVEGHAVNLLDDIDVRGIVLTTRNVTNRKLAELELAAARDAAVQSLQVRTEFVASVSHELRTPIHGVLGLAELLASNDLDAESASLVRSIQRATEALRGVLDDVLDFAKIEAGRLELDVRPTSLPELLDDIVALFRPQCVAKGVDLRATIDPDLPVRVSVDPLRVRQVLTNLVGNAAKFTPVGYVSVACRRDDDALAIAVTDTGIGIGPEAVGRIFEPFSQAHTTTAREFGGTGLGLTISRRLLEIMGGSLEVESALGKGTTFTARMPLDSVAWAPDLPSSTALLGPSGHGRVLVVEDNPVNQLLVTRQLERLGYEPHVVDNGGDALHAFIAEAFDVVLMDWRMPGIDGLATTGLLREAERDAGRVRVPVIGMTANVLSGDREKCLEAGMDDVVAKPVNLATLGRTLATWLSVAEATGGRPFDRGVIDRLVDELDDPAIVATVIATYLRELGPRVEGLEDAARTADRDQLRLLSHTLSSTSAAVGALELAEVCRAIERSAEADVAPHDGLEATLTLVRRLAGTVAEALAAVHADLVGSP